MHIYADDIPGGHTCGEWKYFPGEAHCHRIFQFGSEGNANIRQIQGNWGGGRYTPRCENNKRVSDIEPSDWMYTDKCEPLGVLDGPFNEQAFVS